MEKKNNSVNNAKNVNNNNVNSNSNSNNVATCFIEKADAILKGVATDLRNGNRENNSISRVLKDMQRAALLDAGYKAVFEALQIDVTKKKMEAKTFFAALQPKQSAKDKKGNTYFGIWGYKTEKDTNGNVIKREKVLRKVTAWTPNKVFRMIAQSIEIKNESNAK